MRRHNTISGMREIKKKLESHDDNDSSSSCSSSPRIILPNDDWQRPEAATLPRTQSLLSLPLKALPSARKKKEATSQNVGKLLPSDQQSSRFLGLVAPMVRSQSFNTLAISPSGKESLKRHGGTSLFGSFRRKGVGNNKSSEDEVAQQQQQQQQQQLLQPVRSKSLKESSSRKEKKQSSNRLSWNHNLHHDGANEANSSRTILDLRSYPDLVRLRGQLELSRGHFKGYKSYWCALTDSALYLFKDSSRPKTVLKLIPGFHTVVPGGPRQFQLVELYSGLCLRQFLASSKEECDLWMNALSSVLVHHPVIIPEIHFSDESAFSVRSADSNVVTPSEDHKASHQEEPRPQTVR